MIDLVEKQQCRSWSRLFFFIQKKIQLTLEMFNLCRNAAVDIFYKRVLADPKVNGFFAHTNSKFYSNKIIAIHSHINNQLTQHQY
jgi:hypothetical protein